MENEFFAIEFNEQTMNILLVDGDARLVYNKYKNTQEEIQ